MTHTLNRTGLANEKPGEEMVVLCMAHHKHKQDQRAAMQTLARIVFDHQPNNFIGSPLGLRAAELIPLAGATGIITAVFTDKNVVAELVKTIKRRKLGISVVLSGLYDDVHDICQQTGLTEHTTHCSAGVFGRTDRLPDHITMEITTQCGHALVSPFYVKDIVRRIRRGKMTAKEGSDLLAKPCVCGIVNKKRTEEILARMAQL
jgi:hypothetical protein